MSALDADSEGVEGKYYVWTADEIDEILGVDAPLFRAFYDVTPEGNWEDKCILNRLTIQQFSDPATEDNLRRSRETLLAHRSRRVPPGKDDKVLTDWNGLMITALANAGLAFDKPAWIDAARQAFEFVHTNMSNQDRLWHSWCDGKPNHPATLDDYAAIARAALALFEATGDAGYMDRAEHWVAIVDRHYRDPNGGGYYFAADDTPGLITRTKSAHDNAVPSGNGMIANVFARLYFLTGNPSYYMKAEGVITAFSGAVTKNFFPLSTLLNSAEFLQSATQIVIVASRADAAPLARAAYDLSLPNRLVSIVSPETALPKNHPAHGKGQTDGAPTAYVCLGAVCSTPVIDAESLKQSLQQTSEQLAK
jgi:hypothetical protein